MSSKKQQGAATLFTSVILLIAITLIAFLTAKTVMEETKMTANNYRSAQALAAADAGMDYAVAYFNHGGLNHDADYDDPPTNSIHRLDHNDPDGVDVDGDGVQDFIPPAGATIVFDNNNANCSTANSMKSGLIISTGTSDDGIASRTISQCVGTLNLLKGGGPKQTLVSGSTVGLTGSAQIINRYADLNVWSAEDTFIGNSSAMETYIRPVDVEIGDLTEAELLSTDPTLQTQKVSSKGLGGGTDIYFNDQRLGDAITVTNNDIGAGGDGDAPGSFWDLFFLESKAFIADQADSIGQKLAGGAADADLNGLTGIIWVDGDASSSANGTTIGTPDKPALLIVDGDFDFSGGTINGLVYVTGTTTITGNPNVLGTVISEGDVTGTGTLTLVYAPNVGSGGDVPPDGTGAILSGSWRDW
ncbi:MAG: PilX N-terminal domain-containing pilus assembly protein [Gammaproteobacteria bacterium]